MLGLCLGAIAAAGALAAEPVRSTITLTASQGRSVAVQLLSSGGCDGCPLVLFSHGAYATPGRYDRLLKPWAEAGFLVAAPLHVDSEEYARRDEFDPPAALAARLEDMALLAGGDEFAAALEEKGLDPAPGFIAAGHSYGALIAQVAAGAGLDGMAEVPAELVSLQPMATAVIALSPPGPLKGLVAPEDWASVRAPMLVVTGTTDVLPGFIDDWQLHLVAFDEAASAPAYALIYREQDHYFNGAFGRPAPELDAASEAALASLTDLVTAFMAAAVDGTLPSAERWRSLESETVEARARLAAVSPVSPTVRLAAGQ